VAGLALSGLVLLSPDLTLAPIHAGDIQVTGAPVDIAAEPGRTARGRVRLPDGGLPAPTTAPAPVPVDRPGTIDARQFVAALEAARSLGAAAGVSFAAVRDGEVVWSGGAGRHRASSTEIDADDPLVIGSLTKTFVAATVLQLVEEGRLSLSDSVRDLLPAQTTLSPKITIRQLLDHTSGLADVFNDTTRLGLEEQPERAWTPAEVMKTLHAPWYKPGEGWAYANTNYFLLGLVIERVTGSTLADELTRRFLGPLGLESTRLLTSAPDDGGPLAPAWTTIFWASGAMTAYATDLARWGDALYGGRVVNDGSSAEMRRFNSHEYGLGLQRIEVPGAVGEGHTGLLNTYTSMLLHLPEQDVTLALLVNRSHVDLGGMLAARPANGPSLLELLGVKRATPVVDD